MSNLYKVSVEGRYNIVSYFNHFPDVRVLAKYLNNRVQNCPDEPIVEVRLCQNYGDNGELILEDEEYNMQYFYETYELRLISKHRREQIKKLAV